MTSSAAAFEGAVPHEDHFERHLESASQSEILHAFVDVSRAALLFTAPIAPLVALILTIGVYGAQASFLGIQPISFLMAMLCLFFGWASIATLWGLLGLTHRERANLTAFCELSAQYTALQAAHDTVCTDIPTGASQAKDQLDVKLALEQFNKHRDKLCRALTTNAWCRHTWVLGTGYLNAWQLVHRAQEALVHLEPLPLVALRARYDHQRLAGAHIPNSEDLQGALAQTIDKFDKGVGVDDGAGEMRAIVATVRETINEHRDENRAALVRAKIQLACTTMTVGLITFALLWLALATGATASMIQATAAFFLTGALIGLFARMRSEFDNDTAVDDFGLSAMRHFAAPQLSGIAAVLGVALLTLSTMITQQGSTVQLASAFDLSTNPANILVAAAFGLTPSLLIDRLRQQADTFKNNLRSTEPQSSPPKRA